MRTRAAASMPRRPLFLWLMLCTQLLAGGAGIASARQRSGRLQRQRQRQRQQQQQQQQQQGGSGDNGGDSGQAPLECPVGIDPSQWAQLDDGQRRDVLRQVEAMAPPPPPPPLQADEDVNVAWEEWDQSKMQAAWEAVRTVAEGDGGREAELKRVVASLLGRGWRPVHTAAATGAAKNVEIILDFLSPLVKRAELLRDRAGLTALHHAALAGHTEVMKLLLFEGKVKKKARKKWVDAEDRHGSRPLHMAAGGAQPPPDGHAATAARDHAAAA
jgi:hypothetical protein